MTNHSYKLRWYTNTTRSTRLWLRTKLIAIVDQRQFKGIKYGNRRAGRV